jgi:hypothetical protein
MRYSQWIGIAAVLLLIGVCYLPWAYYPDLQKEFTGFFSEGNAYGRPGKVFLVLGIVQILLFLIPRIWAKRVNLLVSAVTIAFAFKSFILYTACYRGICPEKRAGVFLMLAAPVVILVAALLVDLPMKPAKKN